MQNMIYSDLSKEGIYQYGTAELGILESRLTRYFTREYKTYANADDQPICINKGPLALESEELADKHYNEGLELFQSFLDNRTMSYSMAYFDENPNRVLSSNKSLNQAQIDKFELVSERMELHGDEKLLNIGCGFGYFESFLLDKYPNIRISSITHSKVQYDFIMNRKKKYNDVLSSDRFDIFFGKIDNSSGMLLGKKSYNAVCSIGVLEHINNIELFFEIINDLLVNNGRMFHHFITSRNLIPKFLDSNSTLIGEYFPGGKILPFSALNRDFEDFTLESSWFINGMNYWKTLDYWHSNFWKNIGHLFPDKMSVDRIKYWNNYFILCKAVFSPENGAAYGNGQYLYKK